MHRCGRIFSNSTNRSQQAKPGRKAKTGERKERTEWHRIVIFNDRIGDVDEKFLRKGSKVYVEGSLQTRKWTDQDDSGQSP